MKLEKKRYSYIIIAVISIIMCFGFKDYDITLADDGFVHYLRVIGTVESLNEGIIPPLISQYFVNNLGYGINLFYNPIVTYIPAFLKMLLPFSYSYILKFFTCLTVFLSGIFMFEFCRNIFKNNNIAIISAVLYITAPYRLTDIYIRFAMGEFTAFVFIPILLLGLYNLFYENAEKSYYITIGAVGLILTHTITLYYMCFFSILFVILNIKKLKSIKIIKKILINIAFIVTISAFFLVPLLECKMFANYAIFDENIMQTNAEWVKGKTIPLSEIFLNNAKTDEDSNVLFRIGTPCLVFILIGVLIFKKIDNKYKKYYIINMVFSLLCIFMSSEYFPWDRLPNILCKIQYPWRMIGFLTVFLSIVCSINFCTFLDICTVNKTKAKTIFLCIMICLITASGIVDILPYLQGMNDKENNNDIKYEEYILNNLSIGPMQINREYLPTKALMNLDYISNRDENVKIMNGNANIKNTKKENLNYSFEYSNTEKNTIVELPYLYYPYYSVKINNEKVDIIESSNGLISLNLNGEGTVTLKYSLTIYSKIAYIISIISLIIFIIYVIKKKENIKLIEEREN